ncbi:uncharacterized protein LOC128033950 [Gossypium raimondii]|uniref:uncharacterized protein LOC128033950 n=1 Tax=Gossypium raimondii TaxID=29730 RepID=UPI00227C9C8F|nr:uncharacterized protein LOC128033950 [Gossypium raimondii]
MNLDRSVTDDVESNAPAPAQGIAHEESRHETHSQDEARQAFLRMMSNWYAEFLRPNPNVQPPPPPPIPEPIPAAPQNVDLKAEFWLENSIRVFDELSCTPEECLKCAISLLKNSAYRCWKTLVSVVPKERVTWEFFQDEFRKKYISQRFIDQKRKEFLELKQGRMSVAEYEREFVRFSKQECVPTEAAMCKRFEDGLNEDIRIFVGMLELKEFVVLVDRACKAEELNKEKRKAAMEARDTRKRPMSKPFETQSKKSKEMNPRVTTSTGYPRRDQGKLYLGSEAYATSVSSVGSMKPSRLECQHCGRQHPGECWLISRACFKCGSRQHYIKDCPEKIKEEKF